MDHQLSSPGYSGAYHWPPPEDEISLFDIWDALMRRRWLIVGVTAAVTLYTLAYALTRPDAYQYRQVLEVHSIEAPKRVAGALNDKILPEVVRAWRDRHPNDNWNPKITTDAKTDAQLVLITSTATSERSVDIKDVIQGATQRVLERHRELVARSEEQLKIQLQKEQRALDAAEANATAVRGDLSRLDGRAEMLREEISELEQELEKAQGRRNSLIENGDTGPESIAYTIANNEVQDLRAQLRGLGQELHTGIPARRVQYQDKLAELDNLVNGRQASIQAIQHKLETLPRTEALAEPKRSINQVGTSGKLILALGIVLGGMLGVFAAFFVEFVQAARRRRGEGVEPGLDEDSSSFGAQGSAPSGPGAAATRPEADSDDDHGHHGRPPSPNTGTHG